MSEGGRPGVAPPQQSPLLADLGDERLGVHLVTHLPAGTDPGTDAPQISFPALTSRLPNQILQRKGLGSHVWLCHLEAVQQNLLVLGSSPIK